MNERKKYLEEHKYEKWQGKDGKFYTYLPDEQSKSGRRLLKRTTENTLDDAIVGFYKEQREEPYIRDIFDMWIESKLEYGEIQKQTYDRYSTDYDRYISGSVLENVKFRFITEDLLEDFIKSTIHGMKLTSKAWSGLRTLINGIFKYGKRKGYTNLSITNFMGDLDLSSRAFTKHHVDDGMKVFTHEEELRIAEYIRSEKPSLLNYGVLLAFQTGMRCGEMSALKWSDVNGNQISVSKTEIRYKDNGKYVFEVRNFPKSDAGFRDIIITKETVNLLEEIRSFYDITNEYIFFKDGKRMRGKSFCDKLYHICDALGIPRRSIHKARMTYGTKLIDACVPDSVITSQMGHEDIKTTKTYYYYNNKSREEAERIIERALSV